MKIEYKALLTMIGVVLFTLVMVNSPVIIQEYFIYVFVFVIGFCMLYFVFFLIEPLNKMKVNKKK